MVRRVGQRSPLWSWGAVAGLLALAVAQPMACNGDDKQGPPAAEVQAEVLADVGPEVVLPTLQRVSTEAATLSERIGAWAADLRGGGDGSATQLAAQEAWFSTMDAWQEAEVLQIGPAASSLGALGGADRRDEIYSWPTVNRCRVDQETVYATWAEPGFFEANLVNVYGLAALETLLFSQAGVHGCADQVDIVADGSWDALGTEGVQQARADYAAVVAGGIRTEVDSLVTSWDPSGGDFSGKLAAGLAPFDGPESALQAVFDALFYVETSTKDRKLGRPLGLQDCVGDACVSEAESLIAGGSDRWIAANLRSFRTLFVGGEGTGIEDLLDSIDEGALADAIVAALDRADEAAAALTVPIHRASAEAPEEAQALYDAIKSLTDLVKGDLATVLVLRVPPEASGDND